MARTKKIDGFSFEDIVNTNINNDINDNVNVNDNGNVNNDVDDNLKDKENFLENLKPEKEKKLKHYSILILILPIIWTSMARNSEKNGGKSKFCNELFKKFLEDNSLWSEKIASKKENKTIAINAHIFIRMCVSWLLFLFQELK